MLRGFSPCAIESMPSITISRDLALRGDGAFELGGDGQEEQVGEADAVDRRGERRGDAVAELAGVGEVLHHGHEAEHRADDAERRAVDAHALEHFRGARVGVLARVELHFHHCADASPARCRRRPAAAPCARRRPASRSSTGSRPSSPCLRAMLLHSTIFLMSIGAVERRRLDHPGEMRSACFITAAASARRSRRSCRPPRS